MNSAELTNRPVLLPLALTPVGHISSLPGIEQGLLTALTAFWFPGSVLWSRGAAMAAGATTVADASRDRATQSAWRALRERPRLLEQVANAARDRDAANARWHAAAFGSRAPDSCAFVALEQARLAAERDVIRWRAHLGLLGRRLDQPAVGISPPDIDAVLAAVRPLLDDPRPWTSLPADFLDRTMPTVRRSATITRRASVLSPRRREYWLHYQVPVSPQAERLRCVTSATTGDIGAGAGWARVFEPFDADPARLPTVIYWHGLFQEWDQLGIVWRDIEPLVADGCRVIVPEAPWHGRRCPAGRFGGESYLAYAPVTPLIGTQIAAREGALLTAWARDQGSTAVGWYGISLGALSTQLASSWAGGHCTGAPWPDRTAPDALLLVTSGSGLAQLMHRSGFSTGTGLNAALTDAGWTIDRLNTLAPLLDPKVAAPSVYGRTTLVLGKQDLIIPGDLSAGLIERLSIPPDRIHWFPHGHFQTPTGLYRRRSPLAQLIQDVRAMH